MSMRRPLLLIGRRCLHSRTSHPQDVHGCGCSTSGRVEAGLRSTAMWGARPSLQQPNWRGLAQQAAPGGGAGGSGHKSPITFTTMFATMVVGAGVVALARSYEQDKVQGMMARSQQVAGKAAVGGPFNLIDQDGRPFTDKQLLGEFTVLYFGFTHCPDICPDEMEKLAEAVDKVEADTGARLLPVFISVDHARDTPARVKSYVSEFHPRMVGLTGDASEVKAASKAYRVYFNKTTDATDDYLIDHSIIMYLLDPEGEFVTFYGKNFDTAALADSIAGHVRAWEAAHPGYRASADAVADARAAEAAARAAASGSGGAARAGWWFSKRAAS